MVAYRGLLGAFPYAFRRSDSLLFRSYVATSALVGAFLALLFLLALVTWVANPTGAVGEQSLLGVLAILVLVPLFAPVLVVARRRRLGDDRPRVEFGLGLAGYAFVASIYLGLFVSDPNDHDVGGILGVLDTLPRIYGLVPPVIAAVAVGVLVWRTR